MNNFTNTFFMDPKISSEIEIGRAVLAIDLGAIRHNYISLQKLSSNSKVGAAVKANCYGLGITNIATLLAESGCRDFFVANLDEGIELYEYFIDHFRAENSANSIKKDLINVNDLSIYVLNGVFKGQEKELASRSLQPVLNSLDQVKIWSDFIATSDRNSLIKGNKEEGRNNFINNCAIHLNTSMNRLGMPRYEYIELINNKSELLDSLNVTLLMSHLSSSDESEALINQHQLRIFKELIGEIEFNSLDLFNKNKYSASEKLHLPHNFRKVKKSLSNSGAIFLGKDYHFDVTRPGAALYGLQTHPDSFKYINNPVSLYAPIIQIQNISKGDAVGYNSTFVADKDMKVATIPIGYADGYMRDFSSKAFVYIDGIESRVIGRVSMDLVSIDVTHFEPSRIHLLKPVEVIGPNQTPDKLAQFAGTIGYEIITSLGSRYKRVYT